LNVYNVPDNTRKENSQGGIFRLISARSTSLPNTTEQLLALRNLWKRYILYIVYVTMLQYNIMHQIHIHKFLRLQDDITRCGHRMLWFQITAEFTYCHTSAYTFLYCEKVKLFIRCCATGNFCLSVCLSGNYNPFGQIFLNWTRGMECWRAAVL
jgi:hypothetical protein